MFGSTFPVRLFVRIRVGAAYYKVVLGTCTRKTIDSTRFEDRISVENCRVACVIWCQFCDYLKEVSVHIHCTYFRFFVQFLDCKVAYVGFSIFYF